jgi:hypothetical protein
MPRRVLFELRLSPLHVPAARFAAQAVVSLAGLMLASGCDSDDSTPSCSSQSTVGGTYECSPGLQDAGCPPIGDAAAPADAWYPLNCVVSLPACSAFSNATVTMACYCGFFDEVDGADVPQWICTQ